MRTPSIYSRIRNSFTAAASRARQFVQPRPTEAELVAAARLREEVAEMPPLPLGKSQSEAEWNRNRHLLRDDIREKDARNFLDWQVLKNTMVREDPQVMDVELPTLRSAGWLPLLPEDQVGSPRILPGTSSSANLVHHAYHVLRFQQVTGLRPIDFSSTVEVGAGHGSMCRLLYRLSLGRVHSTLLDLPEFSALQRYYLGLVGVPAEIVSDPAHVRPISDGRRLLVATWSLSEMPLSTRTEILTAVGPVDAYLFGFQEQFGETQNDAQFERLVTSLPDVDWSLEGIDHIPGSRYLFGVRR